MPPERAQQLGLLLGPGAVNECPPEIERGGEEVRRSYTAVHRLVVLFADAGDEAVSEVEVHWIVSLRALDV
ncbi:MAG: hypothetical protein U5R31_17105 [Acidimicrobiia bacterium]|nr:hypothetical protein [Acidimicrobiia bacterium]